MAQRKQKYFPVSGTGFQPRLAGNGDGSIPSPMHRLLGHVEAQLSSPLGQDLQLTAENTMPNGAEKFPGWVRAGIFALPTVFLWGGVAGLLRAII